MKWLSQLPAAIEDIQRLWSLKTIENPFSEASCAWVAPVTLTNGSPAILKLGMPHMEAEHEIDGLRFWDGNPTVRMLASDQDLGVMLLERCEPGTPLRSLPETEQDTVIAQLLRHLWRLPPNPNPFRPLSTMTAYWSDETLARAKHWPDRGLVSQGLDLLKQLSESASTDVLLATDLHAGNVLRAQRRPWLVIDPKPFVGDPAYDATQHLLNCHARLRSQPLETIHRFADLLGLNHERIRLWTFARAVTEVSENWQGNSRFQLGRLLAP